jgi:signal transduction histidine kinase
MVEEPEIMAEDASNNCPRCGHPLPRDARICLECGVDLALFAMLADKAYLDGFSTPTTSAPTPEILVPRIGQYLLHQDLITQDKLDVALRRQKELAEQGRRLLLGQTLVQMGFIDQETLDRIVTQQIIELHAALQETNRTLEERVRERTSELRHALDRLTEISQIKANLISNISHELRTPLAHVKGYIELLADEQLGPLTPEQGQAMDVILRASQRLGRLIEDLIEFSTASREGLRLQMQHISLADLTSNIIERSQEKAEKAGVTLHTEIEPDLPPLQVDPDRLSWVLFQLLDNGIKFTPSGGRVTFTAKREDRQVLLTIQDTGIGIPREKVEEIFEPFHQLDASPTRRFGGTGLGLALVKLILEAHGTVMRVESEEGKGSTFSFPLRVADDIK